MESFEEMGKKAYEKQIWGYFEEAIDLYTSAMNKYQSDKRMLNNRCMCYIETKDYKSALEDSETLVHLFPDYIKGYYRQGEVFKAMGRFFEAEQAFQQALSLDPNCEDARQQLLNTRVSKIRSIGPYTYTQAVKAIIDTESIEDAVKLLKSGILNQDVDADSEEVYYSDEESMCAAMGLCNNEENDPLIDPANPLGSYSLWIGFVSEAVTEEMLKELFSKYGTIKSVHVKHERTCAFVNYADINAPGKAMKALQGYLLCGRNIVIKFPDNAYTTGVYASSYRKKQKT